MYTEFRLMSLNELRAAKGNAGRVDGPKSTLPASGIALQWGHGPHTII